ANAAKSPLARVDHGGEDRFDPIAEREVGKPDDAGRDKGLARIVLALRRNVCGKFDLTDRAQFCRSFGSLMSTAFDQDGCHHAVAGSGIGEKVREEIAPRRAPEVVMSVDDGELRFQYRLRLGAAQPVFARCGDSAESFRLVVGHLILELLDYTGGK